MSDKNSCANCLYIYTVRDGVAIGQKNHFCRKNPPTSFAVPLQTQQGVQVMVKAAHVPIEKPSEDWCGAHEPAKSGIALV